MIYRMTFHQLIIELRSKDSHIAWREENTISLDKWDTNYSIFNEQNGKKNSTETINTIIRIILIYSSYSNIGRHRCKGVSHNTQVLPLRKTLGAMEKVWVGFRKSEESFLNTLDKVWKTKISQGSLINSPPAWVKDK